jgi:hypothetical protein
MATVSTQLTNTFQNLATGECYAQVDGSICIGFGAVLPTVYHVIDDIRDGIFKDINYSGNYGAMWMKSLDSDIPVTAIVTQA